MSATVSRPTGDGWLRPLLQRRPHQVVGTANAPYLERWFVVPRNRFFNVYLQTITSSGLLKHARWFNGHRFVELSPVVAQPRQEGVGPSLVSGRGLKHRGAPARVLPRIATLTNPQEKA